MRVEVMLPGQVAGGQAVLPAAAAAVPPPQPEAVVAPTPVVASEASQTNAESRLGHS